MKILIVEDEEIMRKSLAEALKSSGFEALTAADGEEGLQMALTNHPDMMLVDIMMPKMDGIAMLKEIRKDEWGAHAKVMLLTNVSDVAKIAEAMESGMGESYDYLVKTDWKLEDIVHRVKNRLGMPE
jgi:DNA-binding response OmpR family regulator